MRYLEDTGHKQQEFWAARQRMAVRDAPETAAAEQKAVECLALRLDSLEMHLRAPLEARNASFRSVSERFERPTSVDSTRRLA